MKQQEIEQKIEAIKSLRERASHTLDNDLRDFLLATADKLEREIKENRSKFYLLVNCTKVNRLLD